jgi:hypothetical protein
VLPGASCSIQLRESGSRASGGRPHAATTKKASGASAQRLSSTSTWTDDVEVDRHVTLDREVDVGAVLDLGVGCHVAIGEEDSRRVAGSQREATGSVLSRSRIGTKETPSPVKC